MSDNRVLEVPVTAVAVAFEGGLLVLAWLLAHLLGVSLGGQVVLTVSGLVLGVFATVPLFAGLYWILHTPWGGAAHLRSVLVGKVLPLFADCSVAGLAVISIVAGVGEEALFRGVLQSAAAASIGVVPALLLVSSLFGLVHPVSAVYAVMAGLIGLYLGVLTLWSGTVVPAMMAHALYDFVALTYLVRTGRFQAEPAAAVD